MDNIKSDYSKLENKSKISQITYSMRTGKYYFN
jgi:hypothetical protein